MPHFKHNIHWLSFTEKELWLITKIILMQTLYKSTLCNLPKELSGKVETMKCLSDVLQHRSIALQSDRTTTWSGNIEAAVTSARSLSQKLLDGVTHTALQISPLMIQNVWQQFFFIESRLHTNDILEKKKEEYFLSTLTESHWVDRKPQTGILIFFCAG